MSYRKSVIKSVQYASITMTGVVSQTATLTTPVDVSYSVVSLLGWTTTSGNITADRNAMRVELTDTSTVTAYANTIDATPKVAYFEVIEYFPFALLQAVQPLRLTTATATITAVGAKAVIVRGGFTTADVTTQAQGWDGGATLTDATTVTRIGDRSPTVACAVVDFK